VIARITIVTNRCELHVEALDTNLAHTLTRSIEVPAPDAKATEAKAAEAKAAETKAAL
jgi:hypothetical protein